MVGNTHYTYIYKRGDKTVCRHYQGMSVSFQLLAKFYPTFLFKVKLHKQTTLFGGGDVDVDFDVTERLLIKILCILIILEIKLNFNGELHLLFTDFNKASDSVKKNVFLILLQFFNSWHFIWVNKMYTM